MVSVKHRHPQHATSEVEIAEVLWIHRAVRVDLKQYNPIACMLNYKIKNTKATKLM